MRRKLAMAITVAVIALLGAAGPAAARILPSGPGTTTPQTGWDHG